MNAFINGSISPALITEQIVNHQSKKGIGAHTFFIGQVRADKLPGNNPEEFADFFNKNQQHTSDESILMRRVEAIEFSAYVEMAEREIVALRTHIMARYPIKCLHIFHSLGKVKTGEICFFVFVSGAHRNGCFSALEETVELFKKQIPVWKKLFLNDGSTVWKEDEHRLKHKEH
jgi:molybdopterin synthase catalytic subunit